MEDDTDVIDVLILVDPFILFCKCLFVYFERARECMSGERGRERERRENPKQALCSAAPDAGRELTNCVITI